ncbi:MAG: LuxR C-terminal-related transcriptional regulator [Betaproteobacteria bacterium]
MARLAERGARAALKVLRTVGAESSDAASFARAGVRGLPELVGADLTTLLVGSLATGKRQVEGFPERALSAADIECFDRFFFQHPLVRFHSAHADGGTHRVSDSLPDAAFRGTALCAEYYRRIGIEHAVAVPIYVDAATLVSFVLDRSGRDFDADDLALLEAVREPLAFLYRQVRAGEDARALVGRFRAWLDAEGWCEIEVDAAFRIRRGNRRGLALLGVAVPERGLRPGALLPASLRDWLKRARGGPAGTALTLDAGARRLALRALPAIDGDGWLLYVGDKAPAPISAPPATCGLSPREREVLDWVAAGKSDAQAAAILGISVRTVQKHLEHVYVKLGVEGRTAAVMRMRATGERPARATRAPK